MKRILLVCTLLTALCYATFGQAPIKINLTRTVDHTFYDKIKGRSVMNMYDLNTVCMSELKRKMTFPKLDLQPSDTAYAEITRQSTKVNALKDQYYFLIFNYKTANPVLVASKSLDFTAADKFELGDNKILKLSLATDVQTMVNYYVQKDTTAFAKIPISALFSYDCDHIDGKYTLRLMDDFAKAGDFKNPKTNFSLAIYDANQNGIFNEPDIDKIFLGGAGEKYFLLLYKKGDAINGAFQQENMILEMNGQKYKVQEIDRNGAYVTILPYAGTAPATLKKFESIPNLTVLLSTGDSLHLKELVNRHKYIYIDLWWKDCPPCIRDIPKLDSIAEKYKNKLTLLGLLDRSDLKDLNEVIEKYHIKNRQAVSTKEVNENLTLSGYPYGVLFSKDGELIKADMNRQQLVDFLESH